MMNHEVTLVSKTLPDESDRTKKLLTRTVPPPKKEERERSTGLTGSHSERSRGGGLK